MLNPRPIHNRAPFSPILLAAAAGAITLFSAAAHAQLTYITSFGSVGSGNGQFSDPAGVALGPDGTVYVTDTNNDRMEYFTPTGTFLGVFGNTSPGTVGQANGFAVSALGTVYVPTNGGGVATFNATGAYQGSFGSFGTGNGQLEDGTAATFGPNGVLYVTDGEVNRVAAFTSTGAFLFNFGSLGTGPGQLHFPFGIAASLSGNVYVADNDNSRINVYGPTGVFQSVLANTGSGNGQVSSPGGLAVSATGTVYVADYGNNRIDTFNSAGTFLASVGTIGSGAGQFFGPSGVAVAPNGEVYVVNTGNGRVDMFFDPTAWVAGTQNFTNIFAGPINVGVGPSATNDILGASLTLNPAMTLNCFGLSVDVGGTLTQAGGTLSEGSSPPGMGVAGTFIYQSGNFGVSGLTVVAGGTFQATQGGALTLFTMATVAGQMSLDGGVTLTGPIFTISSGGLLTTGSTTITLTGNFTNASGGELDMGSPTATVINASSIQNSGLIDGSGRINATVANLSGGQLSVALNQTLTITGTGSTNASGALINLAGGTLHFTHTLTNQSGGIIAGFGALRVDGGLTNSGTLALAGASSVFTPVTNTSTGTIHLSGNQPNVFFNTVANAGLLTVDAGASGTFFGAYTGAGPVTNNGSLFINANSIAGPISGNGNLTLGAGASPAILALNAGSGASKVATLIFNSSSQLDLANNPLVVEAPNAAAKPDAITQLTGEVKTGRNGGPWNGPGIISSTVAANPSQLSIAVADNAVLQYTTFGGQPVDANSILVVPAYFGDANLDGHVDLTDLSTILNNFGTASGAWTSGNFDGASTIDLTDLSDVLNNFGQSLPIPSSSSFNLQPSPLSTPEPTALSLLALPTICLLRRRPRTH